MRLLDIRHHVRLAFEMPQFGIGAATPFPGAVERAHHKTLQGVHFCRGVGDVPALLVLELVCVFADWDGEVGRPFLVRGVVEWVPEVCYAEDYGCGGESCGQGRGGV